MTRNNADFEAGRSWTEADFPTVKTVMSLKALGEAGTEYGTEAKNLTEEDLLQKDSYGKSFNQSKLTADIAKNGVKEPIEVQYDHEEDPGLRFSILNGHHRYIAARNAGLTHVPVHITGSLRGKLPESHEL